MRSHIRLLGILLAVLLVGILVAGCASPSSNTTPTQTPTSTTVPPTTPVPTTTFPPGYATVNLTSNIDVGTYLTDAEGFALYYFALDIPGNGTTACTSSSCLANWSLFDAGTLAVNSPLQAADFDTISMNGVNQTTYRGWPLYGSKMDTSAGQFNGDGYAGIWYVMKPDYSVVIMKNSKVGSYLADGIGNTLYNFSPDSIEKSTCTNSSNVLIQNKTCIQLWPPFSVSSVVVPSLLNASDFTTFTRGDGLRQTAFKGMPLYYFLVDTAPGQTNGQAIAGFGGSWFVVAPSTTSPAAPPTTTTVPPTTTQPSGSGGGSGY